MKRAFTKRKVLFFIGLVGVICFLPSLFFFFCADDFVWIEKSRNICLSTIPDLVKEYNFTLRFRPVINLVFRLNYYIFSLKPLCYHLINVILHIFNAFFLYLLLSHFSKDSKFNLFITFVFLSHFIHEESVFWISSLSTLLGAFLYLASLLLFMNYQDKRRKKSIYFLSIFLFTIALFSREDSFTLPCVILIFFYLKSANWSNSITKLKKQIGCLSPFIIISILYLIFQLFIFQRPLFSKMFTTSPSIWMKNLFYFLGNYLFPVRLIFDLSEYKLHSFLLNFFEQNLKFSLLGLIFLVLSIGFLIFIIRLFRRKNPLFNFGILFSFLTILPYLFLNANGQRFCYLPAIGFSLSLMGVIQMFFQKREKGYLAKVYKRLTLVISTIIILNFLILYERGYWWYKGGNIVKNIVKQTEGTLSKVPQKETVYFVDLPRRIHGAYIFHLGFSEAIKLFYPELEFEIKEIDQSDLKKIGGLADKYVFIYENGKLIKLDD